VRVRALWERWMVTILWCSLPSSECGLALFISILVETRLWCSFGPQ
jgi:hypothetical protein